MNKRFPKQIFVEREFDQNDADVSWLAAYEDVDTLEDETVVAVYELKEVKELQVTRELV